MRLWYTRGLLTRRFTAIAALPTAVLAALLGLTTAVGLPTVALAAPSAMEQAKTLYAEAMAAMEASDYSTALAKFEGAYQLAPDRHAFNYNIASAAELAGDCHKAQTHYKMFLDLVPEHDARASTQKTLEKLATTCVTDEESTEQLTYEKVEKRETKRAAEEGDRAILEALAETRSSARFYAAVAAQHGDKQPFRRLAKIKARQVKRIEKLIRDHGIPGKPRPADPLAVPDGLEEACERGVTQESRSAELYDKVFDLFDDSDIVRVMDRYARRSELRYMPSFRDSCPQ